MEIYFNTEGSESHYFHIYFKTFDSHPSKHFTIMNHDIFNLYYIQLYQSLHQSLLKRV